VTDKGFEPTHDINLTLTIKDRVTGEVQTRATEFGTYWWTEGNGSDDCNRRALFFPDHSDEPCQAKRYIVIGVEPLLQGYSLEDFNLNYEDVK